jgi:hypothetical protein
MRVCDLTALMAAIIHAGTYDASGQAHSVPYCVDAAKAIIVELEKRGHCFASDPVDSDSVIDQVGTIADIVAGNPGDTNA